MKVLERAKKADALVFVSDDAKVYIDWQKAAEIVLNPERHFDTNVFIARALFAARDGTAIDSSSIKTPYLS